MANISKQERQDVKKITVQKIARAVRFEEAEFLAPQGIPGANKIFVHKLGKKLFGLAKRV